MILEFQKGEDNKLHSSNIDAAAAIILDILRDRDIDLILDTPESGRVRTKIIIEKTVDGYAVSASMPEPA